MRIVVVGWLTALFFERRQIDFDLRLILENTQVLSICWSLIFCFFTLLSVLVVEVYRLRHYCTLVPTGCWLWILRLNYCFSRWILATCCGLSSFRSCFNWCILQGMSTSTPLCRVTSLNIDGYCAVLNPSVGLWLLFGNVSSLRRVVILRTQHVIRLGGNSVSIRGFGPVLN